MRRQLAKAFIAYMTPERKPPGYRFEYGIGVTDVSADGREIFLSFTFRSGHRYCCGSSGCHHGLLLDSDFERLRECFQRAGVKVGRPMKIHMRVIRESGALFALNPGGPRPDYVPVEAGWETEELHDEGRAARSENRG